MSSLVKSDNGELPDRAASSGSSLPGSFGIIDVGSNSVRLVVYEAAKRNPVLIFNEKVMCGLGRSVASTGRLDPRGMEQAYSALRRFTALREQIGIDHLIIAATAAVRDASNGPDFLAEAEKICGVPVRLVSGEDEARISALGVLSGTPDAHGIVGDLGGGSLELVPIANGRVMDGATTSLGPLRLMDLSKGDLSVAGRLVDEGLAALPWLRSHAGESFYAVGGVWRNLARIHMAMKDYPIHVLHHYVIPARDAMDLAQIIERLGPKTLSQIPDISERRIDTLPYGALVLQKTISAMKAKDVVISSYGLREGLLYEALSPEEQKKDPLIEGCRDLANRLARFPEHHDEFFNWTTPLFSPELLGETPEQARLRHAGCILADIGWYVHPDYRAHHCLTEIMLAPFSGVDHPGRLFLARVGYHRHEGKGEPTFMGNLSNLVPEEVNHRALVLGLALRLAFTLSGATMGVLPRTVFKVTPKTLSLQITPDLAPLIGEVVIKRLQNLAKSLDRKGEIEIIGQ